MGKTFKFSVEKRIGIRKGSEYFKKEKKGDFITYEFQFKDLIKQRQTKTKLNVAFFP